MFLETITLALTTPCLAEPGKIIVTGNPSRPLDDVLPYLVALPNVIGFNPDTLTLTLRCQPGFVTIYHQQVTITQVVDVDEGLVLLDTLKDAINATWEHRHELMPVTHSKRPPRPLDICRFAANQLPGVRPAYLHGFCSQSADRENNARSLSALERQSCFHRKKNRPGGHALT